MSDIDLDISNISRQFFFGKSNLLIISSEKLEIYQQISLVNFIQTIWWRKTKNIGLVKKLENLKYLLRKNIQPRVAWEIAFLKISMEDI